MPQEKRYINNRRLQIELCVSLHEGRVKMIEDYKLSCVYHCMKEGLKNILEKKKKKTSKNVILNRINDNNDFKLTVQKTQFCRKRLNFLICRVQDLKLSE